MYIIPVAHDGFVLLGSPIGSPSFCDLHVQKQVEKLSHTLSFLSDLRDSQMETTLLRSCLGFPKISFLIRTCPPPPALIKNAVSSFDSLIRQHLDDIVGGPLNSWSYTKTSLPISLGGLGLHRASLHAPAAYISSISSTEWLVSDILDGTCSPPPLLSSAFLDFSLGTNNSYWSSAAGIEFPLSQKNLSCALDEASYTSLLHEAPNQRFNALTLSTLMPHAGDWLNVIPSPALGLSVEDLDFRHCLQYWLGTPMFPSKYAPFVVVCVMSTEIIMLSVEVIRTESIDTT